MRMYIFKRLLLIVPTLFLILLINFAVIQIAPGGPVEQAIQQAEAMQTLGNLGGAGGGSNVYQGALVEWLAQQDHRAQFESQQN